MSRKTPEQRRAARRNPLRGFPITDKFESIESVREYTSRERVICLLCGREFKKLGSHIEKVHEITRDEYRELYNIPYRHPLSCGETRALYSENMKRKIEDGTIVPDPEIWKVAVATKKRMPKFKGEIASQNLGAHILPKRPLVEDENGSLITYTEDRDRRRTRRGSEEYKDAMRGRPQCSPDVAVPRLRNAVAGKKQSESHLRKRIDAMKATLAEKKAMAGDGEVVCHREG